MPPTQQIGVLIVEDHQMVAEMLAKTLSAEPDIEIVGRVGTCAAGLSAVAEHNVDVVLMDFRLPDGDGISAARAIRAANPQTRVIILTGEPRVHLMADALRAGCAGYLNKSEGVDTLATAVRGAHAGITAVSPEMLTHAIEVAGETRERAGGDALTERELDVLRLLADGVPNSAIAAQLFISPNTVRNYTQRVLAKLDAHSKLEAVTAAIRTGLVPPPH